MRSMNKMSAEDIAKLKAVALYVLDKCGETDFIHLFKIIYFAERNLYVIIALKQYRLYHSNDTASLAWLQVSLFTWLAIPV